MSDENEPQSADNSAQIGRWMIIALWVILLGLATMFGQRWLDKRSLGQVPVNITGTDGRQSVQLEADRRGHYVVAGSINGETVTFLVDTGATGVSIPHAIAEKLRLERGQQYPVYTANGPMLVWSTRLDNLAIGSLGLSDVEASISPKVEGDIALLGMSWLRHFELVQRQGLLTIREP